MAATSACAFVSIMYEYITIQLYVKAKTRRPRRLLTDENWRRWPTIPAAGEPMRLKILQALCRKPRTVTEIVDTLGATQANVSKHLALLAPPAF